MLEVLFALKSLGARVLIAGLKRSSDNYWDKGYEARYVEAGLAGRVFLFHDRGDLWIMGRFLVNPVFGGTGQPIKTIEAMGQVLPPLSTPNLQPWRRSSTA
jgi:hypothetical protein